MDPNTQQKPPDGSAQHTSSTDHNTEHRWTPRSLAPYRNTNKPWPTFESHRPDGGRRGTCNSKSTCSQNARLPPLRSRATECYAPPSHLIPQHSSRSSKWTDVLPGNNIPIIAPTDASVPQVESINTRPEHLKFGDDRRTATPKETEENYSKDTCSELPLHSLPLPTLQLQNPDTWLLATAYRCNNGIFARSPGRKVIRKRKRKPSATNDVPIENLVTSQSEANLLLGH